MLPILSPCETSESASEKSDGCLLQIGVLGINFKTASLELHEEMARAAESLSGEKGRFFQFPTVVLSTCNRTEIYFGGYDLAAIHSDLLAWFRPILSASFSYRVYSYFGMECFIHLCRVTAGLDSAILAETEIQRQVKESYQRRAARFPLSSALHYTFQKALKVGKMIRNQFPLFQESQSLFSTIWRLASSFFEYPLSERVLFVGYSEINRSLLARFVRRGFSHLTLCTQHPLAVEAKLPCPVVGREALASWPDFSFIICSSRADHYLIPGPGAFGRLVFDLSVPRIVDPSVGFISRLYNMEQINEHLAAQRKQEEAKVQKSEELVRATACRLARIYKNKTLKIGMPRVSWEGDHIADVFHAGSKEDKPLEAEAKTCVGDRSEFSQL